MLRENNNGIEQDGNGSNALACMRNEKNSFGKSISFFKLTAYA